MINLRESDEFFNGNGDFTPFFFGEVGRFHFPTIEFTDLLEG